MMPDFSTGWFAFRFAQIMAWMKGSLLPTALEQYKEAGGDEAVDALIEEAAAAARENMLSQTMHPSARRDWLIALKRGARDAEAGRRFLWAAHGAGGRMFCAYNAHEMIYTPTSK